MNTTRWYPGWTMIAVAIVFQGVSVGSIYYGFTFWIGPWTTEFGVDRAGIMLAMVVLTIMVGLLSPAVGRAMDRLPIRMLVATGGVLQAVGFVLIAMASAAWQIVLIYATLLPTGLILTGPLASQSLAVNWFRARRGLATGIVVTGIPIGGLLMPHLLTALSTVFGWRVTHMILAAFVLLLITVPAWFLIRNTPEEAGVQPESHGAAAGTPEEPAHHSTWTTRAILSQRAFWVVAITLLILNIVVAAVLQNAGPRAEDLGFSLQQASFLVSALAAALIVGNVAFGSLADRWPAQYIFWLAAALACLSLYLMIGQPGYPLLLLLFALMGLAEGCLFPVLSAVVSRQFGRRSFGQVAGLVLLIIQGFGMFGAMLMGWVRDRSGSYDQALMIGLATMVAAAVLMAWLPRTQAPKDSATRAGKKCPDHLPIA